MKMNNFIIGIIDNADFIFYSWSYLFDFIRCILGNTGSLYHAWINVYLDGQGWVDNVIYFDGHDWKLMDPTFASSGKQSQEIMQYIGNGSNYKAKYSY